MTNTMKAAMAAAIIAAVLLAHFFRYSVTCAAAGGASEYTAAPCYVLDRWTGEFQQLAGTRATVLVPGIP